MTLITVDWGGDGDYDGEENDEEFQSYEVEDYGCLYGDKCCMPGLHYVGECHTKDILEDAQRLAEFREIKQLFDEVGWVKREQILWMIKVLNELLE